MQKIIDREKQLLELHKLLIPQKNQTIVAVLITGPIGCGKTMLAEHAIMETGFKCMKIESPHLLENANEMHVQNGVIFLLDDYDAFLKQYTRRASGALITYLNRRKHNSSSFPILIITCANPNDRCLTGIKTHCHRIALHPATVNTIVNIIRRHNPNNFNVETARKCAKDSGGDIRQALLAYKYGVVAQSPDAKKENIFLAVSQMFENPRWSIEKLEETASEDDFLIPALIQQNYVKSMDNITAVSRAADHICMGDVFQTAAFWELSSHRIQQSCVAPCKIRNSYTRSPQLEFPTNLSAALSIHKKEKAMLHFQTKRSYSIRNMTLDRNYWPFWTLCMLELLLQKRIDEAVSMACFYDIDSMKDIEKIASWNLYKTSIPRTTKSTFTKALKAAQCKQIQIKSAPRRKKQKTSLHK